MTDERAIGRVFDSPHDVFNWMNTAVFGNAAMDVVNRSGVTAILLERAASAAELAAATALPEDRLTRILDYLVAHELIGRDAQGRYCGTPRTAMMRECAPLITNIQVSAMAASRLYEGLRDDRIPFEVFFGQPVFEYFRENPALAATFGSFMSFMTRRVESFLHSQHRFHPFSTVADIGGSMGDLLMGILAQYPGTRGILFDLPGTVEIARPLVAASPMAERVELVGGSFFDEVPAADLYTMKQILHDWDDHECGQILRVIRRAIGPDGRLAVIDHILSDTPQPDEAQGTDIAMMVWDTGRERRLGEFEALFAGAGFAIDRVARNPNGHSVMELVPV